MGINCAERKNILSVERGFLKNEYSGKNNKSRKLTWSRKSSVEVLKMTNRT